MKVMVKWKREKELCGHHFSTKMEIYLFSFVDKDVTMRILAIYSTKVSYSRSVNKWALYHHNCAKNFS